MSKIKVAHIITLLELGGAQQNTLFTVKSLDRNQFDVVLIAGKGGILDSEAQKILNLKVFFLKNLIRPVHPWKDLKTLFEMIHLLKQEKIQLVHTHSSKAGIIGRLAAWVARTPIIIHSIHGFGFNSHQKFVTRKIFILLEKWAAFITHKLIAVSKKNIDLGLSLKIGKPQQYLLIRSGVDIQGIKDEAQMSDPTLLRKRFNIPPQSKVILTIGSFKIQKDPLMYIQVAKRVSEDVPNVKFMMIGDGGMRPEIEAAIQALKLKDTVQLLGWRRDVPQFINLCDIFVMTSLWEGLPRAIVEALVLGKPVVAFAVDGIPEVVLNGVNGYALPPGNRPLMVNCLVEMLKNPYLLARLGCNTTNPVDYSFDIRYMVRQQEELYLQLYRH